MLLLPFSPAALEEALAVLREGSIVAHATETCYGLACDLSNPDAVAKLFAIKQRPMTHPVSALFASVKQAQLYVQWNERAATLAGEHLPGPLTLILPLRPDAPTSLCVVPNDQFPRPNGLSSGRTISNFQTLGVRVSSHPHAQALVEAFGSPISTTSANIHGLPNPYSAEDILAQFADAAFQPDLILDSGPLPQTPPSTVIDVTKEEDQTVRKGDV